MEISFEVSQRINRLKFPLSVLIVVIHAKVAYAPSSADAVSMGALFLQHLFSDTIALCAVPLFFVISGYLLYSHYDCSFGGYGKLLKKRIRSLLLPYFIFNSATLLLFFLFQSHPRTAPLFNASLNVAEYSPLQCAHAVTGIGGPSAAYHLWFIKHLFLMTVYSPLVWVVLKKVPFAGLLATGSCYLFECSFAWLLIVPKSMFFFYLGGFFALKGLRTEWSDAHAGVVFGWYVFIALGAAMLHTLQTALPEAAELVVILSGMTALWTLAGRGSGNRMYTRITGKLLPYALFVYLAQLPLLNLIQKLLVKAAAPLDGGKVLAVYGATTVLTLGICLGLGYGARRYVPRVYSVLVGGRGQVRE